MLVGTTNTHKALIRLKYPRKSYEELDRELRVFTDRFTPGSNFRVKYRRIINRAGWTYEEYEQANLERVINDLP